MLKRPKKREISKEQKEALARASREVTSNSMTVPKSYDEQNFPLFKAPINKSVLVYVPNHEVMENSEYPELRMDKFMTVTINERGYSHKVRSIQGLVAPELGYTGEDPLSEAIQLCWEDYRYKRDSLYEARGLSLSDPEAKILLADERKALLKERRVTEGNRYFTFPIVIIDCDEVVVGNNAVKLVPKRDEQGQVMGKPMFYTVSENFYQEKWLPAINGVETPNGVLSHPGGQCWTLKFSVNEESKNKARDNGRSLDVRHKALGVEALELMSPFDTLTQDWTPTKAMEVLAENALRSYEEQQELADSLMTDVRARVALFSAKENAKIAGAGSVSSSGNVNADVALATFGDASATGDDTF